MASKKDKKPKEKKPEKVKGPRPKFEWDPSDDITWHDFVGLLILFFKFLYRVARLIFAPLFWILSENKRMVNFARADGADRPMNKAEREFVESIPVIFALTGLIGGSFLGILIVLRFQEIIQTFFENISLDFFAGIINSVGAIIAFIVGIIVSIIVGIGSFFSFIWNGFIAAFSVNSFLALLMLVGIGVVVIVIWIVFTETGAFTSMTGKLKNLITAIVEFPDKFRFGVQNWYRKFNHTVTGKLIGEERLATRTLNFFKKSVFYTVLLAFWNFVAGIYIAYEREPSDNTFWSQYPAEAQQIVFAASVLLLAGLVSGVVFFLFLTKFLDSLNRKKYISPEFILEDGSFDGDLMKIETEKVQNEKPWLREYVPKSERPSEDIQDKPWKKPKKEKAPKKATEES